MAKQYLERKAVLNLLKKYGIKRGNKVCGLADIGDVIESVKGIDAVDAAPVVQPTITMIIIAATAEREWFGIKKKSPNSAVSERN